MDDFLSEIDEETFLHYTSVMGQYGVQEEDHYPAFDVLSVDFPNLTDPVTTTTIPVSPVVPSDMPPVTTVAVSQSTAPINIRRTPKAYPCRRCHKVFKRRSLSEGCENRHNKVRPFHCTKRCGNPNCTKTFSGKKELHRHDLPLSRKQVPCRVCQTLVSRHNRARHEKKCSIQSVPV